MENKKTVSYLPFTTQRLAPSAERSSGNSPFSIFNSQLTHDFAVDDVVLH
jgi:hypothetical protein